MDFITTELQKKKRDNKSKGQKKKHGLEEQVYLKGGVAVSGKKKEEFVLKEAGDI